MSEEKLINETPPTCVSCRKPIPECTWIYYGGPMGSQESPESPRNTIQIYWCEPCFQEKVLPKLTKET